MFKATRCSGRFKRNKDPNDSSLESSTESQRRKNQLSPINPEDRAAAKRGYLTPCIIFLRTGEIAKITNPAATGKTTSIK